MKNHTHCILWFLVPLALWAQQTETSPVEIDMSDVIIVEDAPASESRPESVPPAEVVEIPDAPIEGATIDMETPEPSGIPEVTESLPIDTEVVLEMPGQDASQPGEASLASEETISVDFPDEDVRTILRNVADLFELNLVIPDTLQGRTSIKLRNISWRQAFEVVLDPLGYTYVEDRNIIRIKSVADLTTEPVDTRVFVVNYAQAGDLAGSIAPLIDNGAGGRIQVDARSNALVITERPSRMNKIQEIIERLDKATDQVMIESKFIEVTNSDVENLGVNWTSLSGYSATAGPFQRQWTRERSSSDGGSSTGDLNSGSSTQTSSGSVDGNPMPEIIDTEESIASAFSSLTNASSDASTSRIDTALFSAEQFEIIISALKTQDDVKLVSNPTVVTLNNTQAKIAIGERFPIPEYTFNAETGERQLNQINYEDIGINLDVTPQVNSAGFINLKIIPEVSSTDRFASIENTQIPIIDSRRTETTIMIKDGYTLAIGGLVEDSITKRETKVPVLGSLPGIGRLFSSQSDEVSQRNLIIFITAKTLNPDGSTYRDIIDPRVIDQMGIVPSELPGYDLTGEERALLDKLNAYRVEAEQRATLEEARERVKAIESMKKQEAEAAEEMGAGKSAR